MLAQAVTKEMLLACDNAAMKQTLTWLWEEAIAALGPCKRPGDEVRIVVNLIEMSAGLALAPHQKDWHCNGIGNFTM